MMTVSLECTEGSFETIRSEPLPADQEEIRDGVRAVDVVNGSRPYMTTSPNRHFF